MDTKVIASAASGIAIGAVASAVLMYEGNIATPEVVSGIVSWFEGKQLSQLFNLESSLLASPYILLVGGLSLLIYFRLRTLKQKPEHDEEMSQLQIPVGSISATDDGIALANVDSESVTTLNLDDLEFDTDEDSQSTNEAYSLKDQDSDINSDGDSLQVDLITEAKVYAACGRKSQAIGLLLEAFNVEDIDQDAIANELVTLFGQEMENAESSTGQKSAIEKQRDKFLDKLSKSDAKLSDDTWKRIQPEDYPVNIQAVM